jgi:hypothetical protein
MQDMIIGQFRSAVLKCIQAYAKKHSKTEDQVQLLLSLQDDGTDKYQICFDCKPQMEVSFLDVLGVKIDFMGRSLIVPPFIVKALHRLAKENGIHESKVSVMIIRKGSDNIRMCLYDNGSYKKDIATTQIFSETETE